MRNGAIDRELKRFEIPALYPQQKRTVEAIMDGTDTLSVFPTGGGKSLCYQLPAMLLQPKLTVVASPLIALMEDQITRLRELGIDARTVNHTMNERTKRKVYRDTAEGEVQILYAAPETLSSRDFYDGIGGREVGLVAVDEAHCISSWGHNFRPTYLTLSDLVENLGNPPTALFTATAPPIVRDDIKQKMSMRDCEEVVVDVLRENIRLRVKRFDVAKAKLGAIKKDINPDEPTIIYCGTRSRTIDVIDELKWVMRDPAYYHAGLIAKDRTSTQRSFMLGDVNIMSATNAFGMGVDKSDIRRIIHFDMPSSPEAYYQEIGRAGRDGEPAEAILYYHPSNLQIHMGFALGGNPPTAVARTLFQRLKRLYSSLSGGNGKPPSAAKLIASMESRVALRDYKAALGLLVTSGALTLERGECIFNDDGLESLDDRLVYDYLSRASLRIGWMQHVAENYDDPTDKVLAYMRGEESLEESGATNPILEIRLALLEAMEKEPKVTVADCRKILNGSRDVVPERLEHLSGRFRWLHYVRVHDHLFKELEWMKGAGLVEKAHHWKTRRYAITERGKEFLESHGIERTPEPILEVVEPVVEEKAVEQFVDVEAKAVAETKPEPTPAPTPEPEPIQEEASQDGLSDLIDELASLTDEEVDKLARKARRKAEQPTITVDVPPMERTNGVIIGSPSQIIAEYGMNGRRFESIMQAIGALREEDGRYKLMAHHQKDLERIYKK